MTRLRLSYYVKFSLFSKVYEEVEKVGKKGKQAARWMDYITVVMGAQPEDLRG